jgi:hypothetical protein
MGQYQIIDRALQVGTGQLLRLHPVQICIMVENINERMRTSATMNGNARTEILKTLPCRLVLTYR